MKVLGLFRCVLLTLVLSTCAHTTTTGEHDSAQAPDHGEQAGTKETHLERTPKQPGEVVVTSSPADLLRPGAAAKIQHALSQHGLVLEQTGILDEQTAAALRRFQKKESIAEHGMPDELTLSRLGLDPKTIFRAQ